MSTTTAGPGSTGPSRHVQCSGGDRTSRSTAHSSVGARSARYRALMPSTTAGSASVVVSPSASSSATLRSSRRMILPERVFGSSSVKRIVFGFAIGPMSLATWSRSSSTSVVVGLVAAAQDHERGDRLAGRRRRSLPTTAASATAGWSTSADSTSVVEMLWPGDEHDVVDPAEQPEVALVVALGAVAGEVACRRSGSSTSRGSARGSPQMPRSIDGHGRVEHEVAAAGDRRPALPASSTMSALDARAAGTSRCPGFSVVAPGSGLIMIAPVSVCHHVSTTGQRSPPIVLQYQTHASGLIGSPTDAEQPQRRQVVTRPGTRRPTS